MANIIGDALVFTDQHRCVIASQQITITVEYLSTFYPTIDGIYEAIASWLERCFGNGTMQKVLIQIIT
ncbi:MAG: hypothetical protein HON50_11110 [Candidatus Marinimicrobia bacterium]|jgi:hypothetical protein|nr:hypothetical protein [Candidatus Neomarinimicrobiota bacterium]